MTLCAMGHKTTDELITSLAQALAPVRPLRAPAYRAVASLGVVLLIVGFVIVAKGNLSDFRSRFAEPRMVVQCAAALLTAIAAIVAAFYASLPDRSLRWRLLPLPPLAVWIAASGVGCEQYGLGWGPMGERLGRSTHCFVFIIGVSAPLALFLGARLRRVRPIDPLPVAVTAALGAAALAAFSLQFFHPFDITWVDLAVHLAAVSVVVGSVVGFGVAPHAERV